MSWHPVLPAGELEDRTPTAADVDGRAVCLVRLGEELHAFDDACPHRQWPLHLGALDGAVLRCRAHTWEWDVRDGSLQRMRAPECLTMHETREQDGMVEVFLDPAAPAAKPLSPLWKRQVEAAGVAGSAS
ncbi:MAG: Rieske (2Fe-2S) domain protein [Solirubrobacterales bacterium]|nr:Rieske (2Fe-2S) domain protein [Solirubrobacterales bacterium]